MMRVPYAIDNITCCLSDVPNDLLQREREQQVDIGTTYISIQGFELLLNTLPGVWHFRLLLGDKPLEGEDIRLRPDSTAYLWHELNAEPFTEATLRLFDVAVQPCLGRDPHESGRN